MTTDSREHYFFELSLSRSALMRWFLLVCAVILGGIAGFLSVLIAQSLLKFGGSETSEKHGISSYRASRLGGVVIFGFMALSLLWHQSMSILDLFTPTVIAVVVMGFTFFSIGLFEDLKGLLKANTRFVLMIMATACFLLLRPEFILANTGLWFFDSFILKYVPIAFLFTLLGLVFLVNSFNTADGANGLVSGVSIFAIIGLVQLNIDQLGSLLSIIGIGCAIFWLFNVTVGRIFLGDGGAYFLGLTLGFSLIVVSNQGLVSPWYLLCLVFYPHADLLFTMIRRQASGQSLFAADNGHLHNLMYTKISSLRLFRRFANTYTGLLISVLFAGAPLLIMQVVSSINWALIYAALWLFYVVIWLGLSRFD